MHVIEFSPQGDYVIYKMLMPATVGDGHHWAIMSYWLIPGTEIEE